MESRLQLLGESLDALPVNVSVLDDEGTIVQTNQAWREFGRRNDIRTAADTIGTNYLEVCAQSSTEMATETRRGLAELLAGTREQFRLEYPCHSPVEQRWFLLVAVPTTIDGRRHAVVAHINVTEYKLAARRHEQELAHLEALTDLSAAIREVTHAVIDQSSRAEIDETVCSALVETTGYDCAWVGAVDGSNGSITVRASAGDCIDGIGGSFGGPFGETVVRQAIWTHEVQTTSEIHADPAFDWREESGEAYTEQAVAAVPITHRGTVSGVCCISTDRSTAFGPDERRILAQLGAVVGHAIAASERTQALMSDELIEVDLRIPARFEQPPSADDWRVEVTQTVASDGDYVLYGTTTDEEIEPLSAAVDREPDAELTVIGGPSDAVRVAIRLAGECVTALLAAHGWSTDAAVFEGGDCVLTVHLPAGDSVRELLTTLEETVSDVELLARRQIHADPVDTSPTTSTVDELTDRQRTVLKTAYAAGYFEWPRGTSGEEIAETLGISPPTFHQHLRLGEGKLMAAVLADEAVGG
ncbi:MAG: helix-turn-helix domain-containing protein [Halohasta sp.]